MEKVKLNRIVRQVRDLPTLPRTMLKITEVINHPESSAEDLARVITQDQVLTARLLKLVNSSFYGFPRRVNAVTSAIVLVGFDAIRNLLLTSSVFDLFSDPDGPSIVEAEKYWDHALGCAVGAKIIGTHLRMDHVEELFVCGLLHDIGKIVAMRYLPELFAKVQQQARQKGQLIRIAESEVLGFHHGELGQLVAERWNLSAKLVKVIAHHHGPAKAGAFAVEASVVHLADILCRALQMGSGGDEQVPPLDGRAWQLLRIEKEQIEVLMAEIETAYRDIRQFMLPEGMH